MTGPTAIPNPATIPSAVRSMALSALIAAVGMTAAFLPPAHADDPDAVEETASGRVTLNFRDMEIEGLIQAVSRITGRNFVVDPRVKAKVTVISERPMAPAELYETFLSILQVHGFAAVESGNITKIIPDVDARATEQAVNPKNPSKTDDMVTEVVRLRFVPASPLLTVLRQIMPQQAALAVAQDSNALVITDRVGNVRRLKAILERIDRPAARDVQIVPLEHASATSVVETLDAFFGASGSGGGNAAGAEAASRGAGPLQEPTFVADERSNSVLIGGNRVDRARMQAVILDLDTPAVPMGDTHVFRLRYANAENLIDVLQGVENLGAGEGQNEARAPDETFRISADSSLNALVVTASPNRMAAIRDVIEQLDVRRDQVLVEAIIAEVSNDLTRRLGAQFAAAGTDGTVPLGVSTFNGLLSEVTQAAGGTDTQSLALGLASSLGDGGTFGVGRLGQGGTDFALLVSALSADAGNNILSTPSLLTLDNEEASIVVGQNIPVITGSYAQTGSATSPDNPFQTISREDIGIKLKVTPSISPDGTVRMQIEQEVSSIDNSTQSAAGIITNKRNVNTAVQINDGDVVVLGGLIDDSARNSQQKVPGLGDIPVVGNLFRYRETQTSKRNLMVFIRPIIVHSDGDLEHYSDSQYRRMRQAQRDAWSQQALGDAGDWRILPPKDRFLVNEPVPLPQNIDMLMRLDRQQSENGAAP